MCFFHFCSGFELYSGFIFGVTEESTGLSVLRTFRLLRIIKLVRFLPNLRRQLIVMLRTMDNVAVFFGLLMLFIFIFRYAHSLISSQFQMIFSSILGMNLFGCKFCDPETRICDRKNFDSLLWATVTVFQVFLSKIRQFCIFIIEDSHPRRLEYCLVLWNGKNKSLGSTLFCIPYDIWKLCSF